MSKARAIELGKIKSQFQRLPLPDKFSRIVSVLLGYLQKEHDIAWPSRQVIAQAVGCSEKTVQRNVAAIRQLQLFYVTTVGAEEARRRLNLKRVHSRHTYCLYKLNRRHPLWKGDPADVREAIEVIREKTWCGIADRKHHQMDRPPETSTSSSDLACEYSADLESFDYSEGVVLDELSTAAPEAFQLS